MNITDQAKKQLPPNWLNALDDELKKAVLAKFK